jgi:hypothetical protein
MSLKRKAKYFIETAESLWFDVLQSANDDSSLSEEHNSEEKLLQSFRKYWNSTLAANMVCNLRLVSKEDKLFLPEGDAPEVATEVVGLRLKKRKNGVIVQAKLVGPENEIVTYRITKDPTSNRYVIVSRSGAQEDSRYQDCLE